MLYSRMVSDEWYINMMVAKKWEIKFRNFWIDGNRCRTCISSLQTIIDVEVAMEKESVNSLSD